MSLLWVNEKKISDALVFNRLSPCHTMNQTFVEKLNNSYFKCTFYKTGLGGTTGLLFGNKRMSHIIDSLHLENTKSLRDKKGLTHKKVDLTEHRQCQTSSEESAKG